MVAATQQQQQPPAAAAAPSAEEEALKRNTDCVYFLASPLTCKKGSECEYRHSEYARVNPRDCYFWLNGNCLNPKCGFRHPPLDGLFGTQAAVGTGSVLPPSHTVVTPAAQTPYNSSKQPVPCIFFQKGLCIKGDRCAFLHGPNPTSNKVPQPTASPVSTDPPPQKKSFGGLQKCTQEQKISPANFSKVVEATSESKSVQKAEIAPPRNGVGVERIAVVPKSMDDEIPRHRPTILPPVVNENSSRSTQLHQSQVADDLGFQIGKDTDDLLRESSPGFDVLVDDELRDSNYYHGEDHYDRTGAHDGRNLNSMDSYDMLHSTDYSSVADIDQDKYRDPQSFDSYERMQGYAWEQHRISSERMLGGSAHLERRGYTKADSPGHVDESDLRYRLSKQRRVNGLRSVVSHDLVPDNYIEERSFRGPSRSHQLPLHEGSISNRLRGRIKLPERSSNCGSDINGERGMERGRNRDRLSPGRSQIPHQGRLRDRIKGRVEEDYKDEGRNVRGPRMRREIIDDRNNDFAGPKSLAELKVTKNSEDKIHLSLGKRKHVENQQSEANLSFEGPLPLSEILKRKKDAEGAAYGSVTVSANKDVNNQREIKESFVYSSNNPAVADKQIVPSSFSSQILKDMGESEFTLTDAEGTAVEGIEFAGDQSSNQMNTSEPGTEDGMIDDDGVEYHEYEGDDQRDGDYEYEQVDDGDYNYEEGENAEGEEEYVDDEDGEDFAKKIGVMFS